MFLSPSIPLQKSVIVKERAYVVFSQFRLEKQINWEQGDRLAIQQNVHSGLFWVVSSGLIFFRKQMF